ncbi:hypothetical protein DOTSEDRAFT_70119 [Dothistroma septosporum NZE10]|uniref:Uncharacterized protein n=1 Tax=Dothistroma septosporum (strain NZE10 / CBS 128990) TaxID=675120 RepID=N1PRD4_DOTSN|nr:hypothetical protein DOTSEDRAFT_70119 [Dothistroma septosporum NZE10]
MQPHREASAQTHDPVDSVCSTEQESHATGNIPAATDLIHKHPSDLVPHPEHSGRCGARPQLTARTARLRVFPRSRTHNAAVECK